MRVSWGDVVGVILGLVGSVVWAVSLAIYQQIMEPSGFFVTSDGVPYPNLAGNNTYWPREMRQMGILLALAGVIVLGRASMRAAVAAGALGVAWFGADLWLDRIDIDGRPTAAWLAAAGSVAVAVAAVVSRGGRPWDTGRHLAAGTAAALAWFTPFLTPPWDRPGTADEIAIDSAVTVLSIVLAVGFVGAAVALAVPELATVRSRWLVPVGAAVTVATLVPIITKDSSSDLGSLVLPALGIVVVAAARDVPVTRLLLAGGVSIVLAVVLLLPVFLTAVMLGPIMTALAGNPAVNGADTDFTIALPGALLGLALAAVSHRLLGPPTPAPAPVEA